MARFLLFLLRFMLYEEVLEWIKNRFFSIVETFEKKFARKYLTVEWNFTRCQLKAMSTLYFDYEDVHVYIHRQILIIINKLLLQLFTMGQPFQQKNISRTLQNRWILFPLFSPFLNILIIIILFTPRLSLYSQYKDGDFVIFRKILNFLRSTPCIVHSYYLSC